MTLVDADWWTPGHAAVLVLLYYAPIWLFGLWLDKRAREADEMDDEVEEMTDDQENTTSV